MIMTFKETATSLFKCFVRRSDHNSDRNNGNVHQHQHQHQHQQQQQQQQLNHSSSSNNSDGDNTVSSSLVATTTAAAAAAAHTTTATATATATALVDSTHIVDTIDSSSNKKNISIKHKHKDYVAIATAAEKNKLIEQRQKDYLRILGPLRMGFVEYDENDTIKYYDNNEDDGNDNEDDDEDEESDGDGDGDGDGDEDEDENENENENVFEKDQEEKEEKDKEQEENNTNDDDNDVIDGKVKKEGRGNEQEQQQKEEKEEYPQDEITSTTAVTTKHQQNSTTGNMMNIRQLQIEYMNYATTLPATPEGSIFVRVPEDRFDLPRILITGPHDTPYANGLFYFDCYLKDYPNVSPNVKFLTTGNGSVRFNPNLYNCGKVCLSLLGTWHGPGWISNSSTLLQVILSIQGLIFGTDEPYYNEPGFENFKGQKRYEQESIRYNKEIRKQTLRWGILYPLKKVLWQEERVEKRRLHKIAFKVQQKDEQQQAKEEEEEKQQDNTTTNAGSSSNNKRKSKWSPIWSSSSSPGLGGGKKKKKISSKLPSRRNYEYTEFTEIVMKHFILNADQIQEQLIQWQELDPRSSTKHSCEEVRTLLKRLKELVDGRKIRSRTTSSTATSGSSKSKRRTTTTCATTASSSRCEEEKDDKKKLYSLLGPTITTDAVAPASAVSFSCAASAVDASPSSEDGTTAAATTTTKDFKTQLE